MLLRKTILAISLLILSKVGFTKEMVTKLNGFQIGQYRDVARLELGDPIKKEKYEDGFEYEIFLLKPDTSLYMIFEYSPANLQLIWSIQFTGKAGVAGFKNLSLGIISADVERLLGKPSRIVDAGEYGVKWEYNATNYSVEIDRLGNLSSIKISDDSNTLFPINELSEIPSLAVIVKLLRSDKNEKIAAALCPDVEVSVNGKLYSFNRKLQHEVDNDASTVFELVRELIADCSKVNTKDPSAYAESIRVVEGQNPLHVIKLKKNTRIKEIVLRYQFGKYLIWEIKAG